MTSSNKMAHNNKTYSGGTLILFLMEASDDIRFLNVSYTKSGYITKISHGYIVCGKSRQFILLG